MEQLKPCPFCGSEAEISAVPVDYPAQNVRVYATCKNHDCSAEIAGLCNIKEIKDAALEVVQAWNRRAENAIEQYTNN